jgi:hypothetical protein
VARTCAVCAHREQASINRRLLLERPLNISALAREFEVPRKSMERHRNLHLDAFIAELRDREARPAPSAMQADVSARYLAILELLATAEAGAWQHVERASAKPREGGRPRGRELSLSAVARSIQEVRAQLSDLVQVILIDTDPQVAETTLENTEVQADIRRQLELVLKARQQTA